MPGDVTQREADRRAVSGPVRVRGVDLRDPAKGIDAEPNVGDCCVLAIAGFTVAAVAAGQISSFCKLATAGMKRLGNRGSCGGIDAADAKSIIF